MTDILLATDADWLVDDVVAALAGSHVVHRVRTGHDVIPAIKEVDPTLVLLDMQIGNMGGIAACIAIRHAEGMGSLEERPIMLLLDREVDVFLATEADADGWLIKPLDAFHTLRAVEQAVAGEMQTGEPSPA